MTDIIYREPDISDAQKIVEFYNRVGGETSFLSFELNEYPLDTAAQEKSIKGIAGHENEIMLLACSGDEIICIGTIYSTTKIKARHCGELGIVVSAAYQNRGIGREMMNRLIGWCRENEIITRIQLSVRDDNTRAIALYKDLGFETEGVLKNSVLLHGKYHDTVLMGLLPV